MGRWSQARRRGGGVEPSSTPPPTGAILISVTGTGGNWTLQFDGPIVASGSNDDAAFLVGPATFFHAVGFFAAVITGTDDGGAGYLPGLPWSISSQPVWATTPIAFPQSGTTI